MPGSWAARAVAVSTPTTADRQPVTPPAVTAVVFDLGNVLIEWNRDLLYRKVIPDEERRAQFFRDIATMEWNLALDRGVPFDVGVAELSAEHPAWSVEIEAYRDRWSEMLGPPDDDAVQLAADVRAAGVGPCACAVCAG